MNGHKGRALLFISLITISLFNNFIGLILSIQNGQTALGIANKLGYITVVETLKVVTETNITSTGPTTNENIQGTNGSPSGTIAEATKYKVIAPESMHETFMSDSEDEGGKFFQIRFLFFFFVDIKTNYVECEYIARMSVLLVLLEFYMTGQGDWIPWQYLMKPMDKSMMEKRKMNRIN